ncbi:MAG: AGE family epimerase/isomerase, partial [Bosea sp. (in: a-proteobacteria)]
MTSKAFLPSIGDAPANGDLANVAATLRHWVVNSALPLWATTGFNQKTGLFYERLLMSGEPDADAILRTRVQARQIYVYAHAAKLGWWDDGHRLALAVFDRLCETAAQPGARGFCHLMSPMGKPLDNRRDSYDHAFLLLAFSWLWHVTAEARVKEQLDKLLQDIDSLFLLPDGSVREDDLNSLPRRQ